MIKLEYINQIGNISSLLNQVYEIDELAKTYIGYPFGEHDPSDDRVEFLYDGVLCYYQYNESCGCHPNYQYSTYTILREWFDFDLETQDGRENLIVLLKAEKDKINKEKRLKIDKKKLLEQKQKETLVKEAEDKELKMYLRLKSKFED